jgi:hypothetical protein
VSEPGELNTTHPALQVYRIRNRRAMRVYAAAIALVVLLTFAAVRLAYARGEINKVDKASGPAATPLPIALPASKLSLKWHSDDHPAGGNPYSDGVVVTFDQHSVNGRDALTGAVRWHYRRSDETLCSVVQQDSSTIVIYNRRGNCDEVVGFETATGAPKWYRTLTDNGRTVAASAPNVVLLVADHSVHVIDNAGGLDRWAWQSPQNCSVDRALAGSLGVLISYHCGDNRHLMLRALIDSAEKWNIPVREPQVPIAAHALVAAVNPDTAVITTYSADKGAVGQKLPAVSATGLSNAVSALPRAQTTTEGSGSVNLGVELIRIGTALYALSGKDKLIWTAPVTGAPWVLNDDLVAAPSPAGIVLYRVSDGREQQTISIPSTGDVTPYPLGAGLLLAGTTTRVYR